MMNETNNNAIVTIIMPAFNAEETITEAVRSIQAQTFQDWELLIIDDGSTDKTKAIAAALAETDNRIKIMTNQANEGVSKTRNRGVAKARTEWIAFLDSDDLWRKEKLAKQINLQKSNPKAHLIYTGSAFINDSGEEIRYVLHVPERINKKLLLKQNLISCSSVLVKKELLLKYPMPEKAFIHEDYATWLDILEEETYAYGIDEPLLIYRLSGKSKSGNKLKAALMNRNTYRHQGLSHAKTLYYMGCYSIRNIRKYKQIEKADHNTQLSKID